MNKQEKDTLINELTDLLKENSVIYLTDIEGLNAAQTSQLRRICFNKKVQLRVVKNTLLKKAMERSGKNFGELFPTLKGMTSLMIAESGSTPARLISEVRKKSEKPILKGAYIDEAVFVGDNQLKVLENLKSREELIGDIILLLQSPIKNVVSALNSGGQTIAGLLKSLEERAQN
ncbi:50S ribosomal protein L10 [Schleiferia thermophila]|jgi:large subunit ribosomal protein L10|uniref:50S ribosomal protein L10 n=1 Tax=Schleiferia thermophila TaxID=884107 RepID=UPI0004E6BE9A|nr:50S ribosomal protein L10 [Schleiferia thermophila]KFD39433.1 50S ribosomal protein L10 [Schleiferia thermophila str. Yellowstone]PMB37166.1 50S ribosomal protein L10 [Fischerella thermalis CCMEE 5319]